MLTDAMLREALGEAERRFLAAVPVAEGEPHVFSKRFQKKIEKLMRRVDHPIRYRVLRTAAAFLIVIATLFGAVMTFSPEARAAVVGWVKSAFYEFFEYSSESPKTNNAANNPARCEYHFSVAPDGYRELNVVEKEDGKMYLYINDKGKILQFTYTYGTKNSSLFAETEIYEQHEAFVHELPADVYIALKENETSVIIWRDSDTDVLFEIFAIADQTELVRLAETVKKIKS